MSIFVEFNKNNLIKCLMCSEKKSTIYTFWGKIKMKVKETPAPAFISFLKLYTYIYILSSSTLNWVLTTYYWYTGSPVNEIQQLVTNSNMITLRLETNCLGFMKTAHNKGRKTWEVALWVSTKESDESTHVSNKSFSTATSCTQRPHTAPKTC